MLNNNTHSNVKLQVPTKIFFLITKKNLNFLKKFKLKCRYTSKIMLVYFKVYVRKTMRNLLLFFQDLVLKI